MPMQPRNAADRSPAGGLDNFNRDFANADYVRQVFAQSFQAYWILAPDGTILDANHAAFDVTGSAAHETLGSPLWEAAGWAASGRLVTDVRAAVAAVAGGAFVRFEADVVRLDASITLDLSLTSITDNDGHVVRIVAEGRDVGARARAERALRDSEERFNRIVSIAADAIISMDESQRITMFNNGAEKIFGYTQSETIGQPLEMLLPQGVGDRHAAAVRQFAAGTVDARHMGERREIFGRRKSGEVFRADASISKVTVGSRVVFTAVVRDVTERWMQEQERAQLLSDATRARADAERERERISFLAHVSDVLTASLDFTESLRTIARLIVPRLATVCVVDIVDDNGEIRRVDVVGGASEGQEAADFLRGLTLSKHRPYLTRRAMESSRSELIAEVTADHLRDAAQDERHFDALRSLGLASLVCVPLVARGNTLGVIALGRDASSEPFTDADRQFCEDLARRAALAIDNARLYQRAQDAVRQRDVVLGIVSHDLRNPLSAIGMCVTGLEHGLQHDPAERAQLLSAIRDSVDWAQGLIADLLDIASIESGKLAFEARPLDPVILIARAAHFFDPAAREKSVRLSATAPDEVPAIMADERRTLQVLSNLVSNALKHTKPGGHIRVTAQPAEREVVFAVEDDGPGIPADEVPRLFDRFWHARRGTEQAGTGLGLAIAKGIVDAHGGSIWVETKVGSGSTFKFSLPQSAVLAR
jgi:PAS domain S-box-containing protein